MIGARLLELLGMMMIGEGVLTVADPRGHLGLWHRGSGLWATMAGPFEDHPNLTRCLGAAEAAAGFWLATRQMGRAERS